MVGKVDRVAVKGKNAPFDIYEVIDAETPERAAAKLATRPLLDSAMKHYFGREFKAALAFFERTSKADPEDVVPILFTERCARYLETPPPADWQGFEKLTTNNDARFSFDGAPKLRQPMRRRKMQKLWHRPQRKSKE